MEVEDEFVSLNQGRRNRAARPAPGDLKESDDSNHSEFLVVENEDSNHSEFLVVENEDSKDSDEKEFLAIENEDSKDSSHSEFIVVENEDSTEKEELEFFDEPKESGVSDPLEFIGVENEESDEKLDNNPQFEGADSDPLTSDFTYKDHEMIEIEQITGSGKVGKASKQLVFGKKTGPNLKYLCPSNMCCKNFTSKQKLSNHILRMHTVAHEKSIYEKRVYPDNTQDGQTFSCGDCSAFFDNAVKFDEHILTHDRDPDASYVCSRCKRILKDKESFALHISSPHHGKNEKKTESEYPNKVLIDRITPGYKGPKELNFICSLCDRSFNLRRNWLRHVENVHNKSGKVFFCPNCPKYFSYKQVRDRHTAKNACKRGGNRGNSLQYSRATLNTAHPDYSEIGQTFSCGDCPEIFDNGLKYDEHKLEKHDRNSHVCSRCKQVFEDKESMVLHMSSPHVRMEKKVMPMPATLIIQQPILVPNSLSINPVGVQLPIVPCPPLSMKPINMQSTRIQNIIKRRESKKKKEENNLLEKSKKHYCYDCKAEFSTRSTLDEHISGIHSLNPKLSTIRIQNIIKRRKSKKMKEQNDLMQKSKKHYCYDCKSEFSTRSTLDEHISEIHSLDHKLLPGPKPQSSLETAQPINYFEMNVKDDDSDQIDQMESVSVEEAIEIKDDPVAVQEAIEIKDEPVDEEIKDLDIVESMSETRSLNLEFEVEGVSSGIHKPENEKSTVSPINNTMNSWKVTRQADGDVLSFQGKKEPKKSSSCPNCRQVFKHKQDMEIHFLMSCKSKIPPKQNAEPEFVDCQEPNIVVKEEILDDLHSEVEINEDSESGSGEKFDSFGIGLQVPGIKIVASEKIHMSDEQWQDSCVSCGKKFKYTNCLFKHKCGPVKKFPCPDCDKSFSQKSRLDSHIANRNTRNNGCIQNFDQPRQIGPIHISPKIFQCPDCNKHFSQNSRLQTHLETRNNCLSTFQINPSTNQNQAELIVGSGASHLCVLCNKTFTLRRNLDRHKLLVHETDQSKITTFTCPRCMKSFTLKQTLTRHVDRGGCKYLDPKKNPLCSVCNIVFVNKKALIKHVQKVHENPMPKPQMPFKDLPSVHQSGSAPGTLRYILPKPPTNPMEQSQKNYKKIAMLPSTQTPTQTTTQAPNQTPIQTLAPVQFIDPNLTPQKIPIFPIPRPDPVIEPNEPKPRLKSTDGKVLLSKLNNKTSKKTINALKKYGIYKDSD